jgi:hypothetical protein
MEPSSRPYLERLVSVQLGVQSQVPVLRKVMTRNLRDSILGSSHHVLRV